MPDRLLSTFPIRLLAAALALPLASACSGDDQSSAPEVLSCNWPQNDPSFDFPIGYGLAKNSAHTSVEGSSISVRPITIEQSCFTSDLSIHEPPASGTVTVDGDALAFTPAADSPRFVPFVIRIDFQRADDPACAEAVPYDDGNGAFLYESGPDGGSDLARIGVHVVPADGSLLAPCEGDECVSVEVTELAGHRFPNFRLHESPPDPDHLPNGCPTQYVVAKRVFAGAGESDAFYSLDYPGVWLTLGDPDGYYEWRGWCGLIESRNRVTTTIEIARDDFESYCEAALHNHSSFPPRGTLLWNHQLAARSRTAPTWKRDWPDVPVPEVSNLAPEDDENPRYESLEEIERRIDDLTFAQAVDHARAILTFLQPEDDRYVRAVRYGNAWGQFETAMVDIAAKVRSGEFNHLPIDEQLALVTDAADKLDQAFDGKFERLGDAVGTARNIQSKTERARSMVAQLLAIYEIFSVDPDDPIQQMTALANYLEFIGGRTGRVGSIFFKIAAEGIRNMRPALERMQARNDETTDVMKQWLQPTVEFMDDMEDFGGTDSGLERPALDTSTDSKPEDRYHEQWREDIEIIRRMTDRLWWSLERVEQPLADVMAVYVNTPWEEMKQPYLDALAIDPGDQYAQERLEEIRDRQDYYARELARGFEQKWRLRDALRAAYAHIITGLKVQRAREPGFDVFIEDYEQTIRNQLGDKPFEVERSSQ